MQRIERSRWPARTHPPRFLPACAPRAGFGCFGAAARFGLRGGFGRLAGPQVGDGGARGDLFGVHAQLDHRGLAALHRAAERRREIRGIADHFAMAAECLDELGEIRIGQSRAGDTARIRTFLVHADRAVHLVVEHQHDRRDAVVERGGDLLSGHQETAVANHADHHAIGERDLGADRGGNAVAHRTIGRTDVALLVTEVDEARGPAGEVAGVRGDDARRDPAVLPARASRCRD